MSWCAMNYADVGFVKIESLGQTMGWSAMNCADDAVRNAGSTASERASEQLVNE